MNEKDVSRAKTWRNGSRQVQRPSDGKKFGGGHRPTEDQCDWSVLRKESGRKNSMGETGEKQGVRPRWTEQEVHGCLRSQVSSLFRVQVSSLSNSAAVTGGWNEKAGLKFYSYWLWSQTGFGLFTFRTLIWCLNCARHCFKCITNN